MSLASTEDTVTKPILSNPSHDRLVIEPLTVTGIGLSIAKWVGGTVSAVVVGRKALWTKTRQLRRGLYRELADNYSRLQEFIDGGSGRMADAANGVRPMGFDQRFFRFAQDDMPTFHRLTEYRIISSIYEGLDVAAVARGAQAISAIVGCRVGMDEAMATGMLKRRLFRRLAPKWVRPFLDANVREREADLAEIASRAASP